MELTKRKELAKYLRWGDKTKIAELASVSRGTVQLWFNGEVKDSVVENYVLLYVEKRKQEIESKFQALTLET